MFVFKKKVYTLHLARGDDEQVVNVEARKHRFGL
jgi:hypothetical protein